MKAIDKLKTVKDSVRKLLQSNDLLRDDDRKLYLAYLNKYHNLRKEMSRSVDPYGAMQKIMLHSDTAGFVYISRARRLIQQKEPSLRGLLWNERQKAAGQTHQNWGRP